MSCICKDEKLEYEYVCLVCKCSFSERTYPIERQVNCPAHKHKYAAMCGLPDHLCAPCKHDGWKSHAGSGGGDGLENLKTGEHRKRR